MERPLRNDHLALDRPREGLPGAEGSIMISRPIQAHALAAEQRPPPPGARHPDQVAIDPASSLTRSALAFAMRCHAGRRRHSDGAAFIAHPLEVARLLREAGCTDIVVAAGLLHDVIEDANVRVAELTAHFGDDVANLVQAVSDDQSIQSYRERKRMLRDQVRSAGGDAALLFAADNISQVRELPNLVRRERARSDPRATRARSHLEHNHQARIEHYRESLTMLQHVIADHPLVKQLANELDSWPISPVPGTIERAATTDHDPRRRARRRFGPT